MNISVVTVGCHPLQLPCVLQYCSYCDSPSSALAVHTVLLVLVTLRESCHIKQSRYVSLWRMGHQQQHGCGRSFGFMLTWRKACIQCFGVRLIRDTSEVLLPHAWLYVLRTGLRRTEPLDYGGNGTHFPTDFPGRHSYCFTRFTWRVTELPVVQTLAPSSPPHSWPIKIQQPKAVGRGVFNIIVFRQLHENTHVVSLLTQT